MILLYGGLIACKADWYWETIGPVLEYRHFLNIAKLILVDLFLFERTWFCGHLRTFTSGTESIHGRYYWNTGFQAYVIIYNYNFNFFDFFFSTFFLQQFISVLITFIIFNFLACFLGIVIFCLLFCFVLLSKYVTILMSAFYFIHEELIIQMIVDQMKVILALLVWLIIQLVMNHDACVLTMITWFIVQTFTDIIDTVSFVFWNS